MRLKRNIHEQNQKNRMDIYYNSRLTFTVFDNNIKKKKKKMRDTT